MTNRINIRRLAARGQLLHDRISAGLTSERSENSEASDRFEDIYTESTHGDLKMRQQVSGLDAAAIDGAAGLDTWPQERSLPDWVHEATRLVKVVETTTWPPSIERHEREIPFIHVVRPLVEHARTESRIQTVAPRFLLGDDALRPAEEWLCRHLSTALAQPLHLEFRVHLSETDTTDRTDTTPSSEQYAAFVRSLYEGKFSKIIERYPLLARRLVVSVRQWRTATASLLSRLADDWPELVEALDYERGDTVTAIEPGQGDLHNRGHSVTALEFEYGPTLYYKPRSVDPTYIFDEIIEYLERRGTAASLPSVPPILRCDGYGWVPHVTASELGENDPCSYYRRVGGLLCLYYVFNGSDLHFENILASGSTPVVIDSETVLTRAMVHRFVPKSRSDHRLVKTELENSVFRTALLPVDTATESAIPQAEQNENGGLTRIEQAETDRVRPIWHDVNTDQMRFELRPTRRTPSASYPRSDGEPVLPEAYVESIVEGFRDVYTRLSAIDWASIRDEIETDVTDLETRYIFRNTSGYGAARRQLRTPRAQRSGVESGLVLERLVPETQILSETGQRRIEPLLEAERRALMDRNVPRFGICGRDLTFRGKTLIANFFDRTHQDVIRDRLSELSHTDREKQCGYITAALAAHDQDSDGESS